MKDVYLKAAKNIATSFNEFANNTNRNWFSCHAINHVLGYSLDTSSIELLVYAEYFNPYNHKSSIDMRESWFGKYNDESQLQRQLALLFMHEIIGNNYD